MQQRESDGHVYGDSIEYKEAELLIYGWLYSHRLCRFSVNSLASELNVSFFYVAKALENPEICALVGLVDHPSKMQFFSNTPELDITAAGVLEEIQQRLDTLDSWRMDVREEFYYRAEEEFHNLRKKYRSTRKFSFVSKYSNK